MLNGAIAILTFLLAIFSAGGGDKVEVREWRLTYDLTFYSAAIHLDPVFVIWKDEPGHAWAWFNVICMRESMRGTEEEAYILHGED